MKKTKKSSIVKTLLAADKCHAGSVSTEYALPLALVVVASGVILSSFNISTLLPDFFAKASGSSVSGATVNTKALGSTPGGATGTGAGAVGFLDTNGVSSTLAFAGQTSPGIETVGGKGTDWQIRVMHYFGLDVPALSTSESDGGLYVPLTVDLALTTNAGNFENAPVLAAKGNAIAGYAATHSVEVTMYGSSFSDNQQINGQEIDNLGQGDNSQSGQHATEEAANVEQTIDQETAQMAVGLASMFGGSGFHTSSNYQPLDDEMFTEYLHNFERQKLNCTPVHIEQFDGAGQQEYSETVISGTSLSGCP